MIEAELKAGPFSRTTLLYSAPRPLITGEEITGEEIASYLRRCGYSEASTNRMGWYRVRADAVEIKAIGIPRWRAAYVAVPSVVVPRNAQIKVMKGCPRHSFPHP